MFLLNYQKTNRIPIVIIIIAVLVGYYKLFYGHDLWLYKDQLINSRAPGNGLSVNSCGKSYQEKVIFANE